MHRCIDVWSYGCVVIWMHRCMDISMYECIVVCTYGHMGHVCTANHAWMRMHTHWVAKFEPGYCFRRVSPGPDFILWYNSRAQAWIWKREMHRPPEDTPSQWRQLPAEDPDTASHWASTSEWISLSSPSDQHALYDVHKSPDLAVAPAIWKAVSDPMEKRTISNKIIIWRMKKITAITIDGTK